MPAEPPALRSGAPSLRKEPMEVVLAGFNLDLEALRSALARTGNAGRNDSEALEARSKEPVVGEDTLPPPLSPETISAAYARISRDPSPIAELRRRAREDVAAARASNSRIVFDYGHTSIAEHAVFNLDVSGISRLALEALEATRLGSYTEKSQRYVVIGSDFVVPREIEDSPMRGEFEDLVRLQHDTYARLHEALSAGPGRGHRASGADLTAREDARYALGLSTTGQVGVTLNARSLEATVRRLAAHPLEEVRRLARLLHERAQEVAPSLIRYTEPTRYREQRLKVLHAALSEAAPGAQGAETPTKDSRPVGDSLVRLIWSTPKPEEKIIAAWLHEASGIPMEEAELASARMNDTRKREILLRCLELLSRHELPDRAFELVQFTFEVVASASCFAQLKRHRMATLIPQAYDPSLGISIPESLLRAGLADALREVAERSAGLYSKMKPSLGAAADYTLTNAHRRRVIVSINARSLYNFAQLRLDRAAQWEIRSLAERMIALARERAPGALALAAGRNAFEEARRRLFPGSSSDTSHQH